LFPPRQGEFTANWVEFVGGGEFVEGSGYQLL
jgi:hypothetical protein